MVGAQGMMRKENEEEEMENGDHMFVPLFFFQSDI